MQHYSSLLNNLTISCSCLIKKKKKKNRRRNFLWKRKIWQYLKRWKCNFLTIAKLYFSLKLKTKTFSPLLNFIFLSDHQHLKKPQEKETREEKRVPPILPIQGHIHRISFYNDFVPRSGMMHRHLRFFVILFFLILFCWQSNRHSLAFLHTLSLLLLFFMHSSEKVQVMMMVAVKMMIMMNMMVNLLLVRMRRILIFVITWKLYWQDMN